MKTGKEKQLQHKPVSPLKAVKPAAKAETRPAAVEPRLPSLRSTVQRGAGNAAIQRAMIQRKAASSSPAKVNSIPVSQPGDRSEREADRTAEKVLHAPSRMSLPITPPAAPSRPSGLPDTVKSALASGGRPLDPASRAFFEPRFGADLGRVRLHTGSAAAQSARKMSARAYTIGQDVVFGAGEDKPSSPAGQRLLAHELAHTLQASTDTAIRREFDPNAAGMTSTSAPASVVALNPNPSPLPKNQSLPPPAPTGATVEIGGITLSENEEQLRFVIERKVEVEGIDAGLFYLYGLQQWAVENAFSYAPNDPSMEKARLLETKILPVMRPLVDKIKEEHKLFLSTFEEHAKTNAKITLEANREESIRELSHYGISTDIIEHIETPPGGVVDDPYAANLVTTETIYRMNQVSPAGRGLQNAAKILLDRRRQIEALTSEQNSHLHRRGDPIDPERKAFQLVPDEQYDLIGRQIEEKRKEYQSLRDYFSNEYPVLAAFSKLDKDDPRLEELATKGPGSETAAVIAQQVMDTLAKIETSKKGLDDGDVTVWHLTKIVQLTEVQLDISSDPLKKKLVDEKKDREKPGIFNAIALLVLNIAALLLAGPTGGLSLVAAAGVNAAVTYGNLKEYIFQDALAGSAFNRAKALSEDEPSLFWLAVDIIGTALDVGTAFGALAKTFQKLAPLAKAAKEAQEAEKLEQLFNDIRKAAKEEGIVEKAETIIQQIRDIRKSEGAALKSIGATEEEIKAVENLAKAIQNEATGEILGKAIKNALGGEITLSKNGLLFSCHSPCTVLREKYLEVIAKDKNLEADLIALEKRAQTAAEEAKTGGKQGEALVEQAKQEAVQLEKRLREVQVNQVLQDLATRYPILEQLGLDAAAVERILAKGDLGQIKGQLLEELLARKVENILLETGKTEGRTLLGGAKAGEKLEFIAGHRIQVVSQGRKQFSDGLIIIREGEGRVRVLSILESKAGKAASRGWTAERVSSAEFRKNLVEYQEAREYAIDLLRDKRPELEKVHSAMIEQKYSAEVDAIFKDLPRTEAGQFRRDIERLGDILIDGKPVKAVGGPQSTKVIAVAPSDVLTSQVTENVIKKAGQQGLTADVLAMDIKQKELTDLAKDLVKRLKE